MILSIKKDNGLSISAMFSDIQELQELKCYTELRDLQPSLRRVIDA